MYAPRTHRIGLRRIPHEWPPAGPREAEERARWVEEYRARARGHAACRLVEDLGTGDDRGVRELHDSTALAFATTPLA